MSLYSALIKTFLLVSYMFIGKNSTLNSPYSARFSPFSAVFRQGYPKATSVEHILLKNIKYAYM